MTFPDHFQVIDEAVGPQPWMQLRPVAHEEISGLSKSYAVAGGGNKNDLMQTLSAHWTNNSPINQQVYGMVTRGGAQVTLQTRSRGYLSMSHGYKIAPTAGTVTLHEVSRFGVGADVGVGGLLALNAAFSMAEIREHSNSLPLMPNIPGWFTLAPGETFHAQVDIRFVSEFWENNSIDGGDSGTTSMVIAGELNLDLYAVAMGTEATPRVTPTIVGGAGNIMHDEEIDLGIADTETSVNKPAGLAVGDMLLAVVVNQWGAAAQIQPVDAGWTLVHSRNDDLWSNFDVHMKIWARRIVGGEPSEFNFTNDLFAEEIAVLIPIRDAPAQVETYSSGWYIASNLSRWKIVEDQVAPSISSDGQLLLAISYFSHGSAQAPINQAPPDGMTELIDIDGVASTLAIAMLSNPPNPTGEQRFVPTDIPIFSGHSITAAILIPGTLDI